jgi:hypothetical protein
MVPSLNKRNKKPFMPSEQGFLTILEDHEIIERYNQYMIGIGNYYIRSISYESRIRR